MLRVDIEQLQSDATEHAAAAFRWWIGELTALAPKRLVTLLRLERPRLLIDIRELEVVVSCSTSAGVQHIGRFPIRGEGAGAKLKAVLRQLPQRYAGAVLRLPTFQVLRRTFPLPLSARSSLRPVIMHELERQMPLRADQIYFDCRILSRDSHKKRLVAEAFVVKRSIIDGALRALAEAGLELSGIEFAVGDAFLRATRKFAQTRNQYLRTWPGRLALGLGVLVGVCSLGLIQTMDAREQGRVHDLNRQLATAKSRAHAAEQLRAKIDELAQRELFLPHRKRSISVMAAFEDVTHLMPDGAWLFDLELKGQEVRAHGFAPSASRLLGYFSQSPHVEHAQFRAPLTPGPRSGLERFDLSFDLREAP